MIDEAFDATQEQLLRDSRALADAMGGRVQLYGLSAPNDAPFPHIIHGESQILPDGDDCREAYEIYSTLYVWTRDDEQGPAVTKAQAKRIGGLVRSLLDIALPIPGFRTVEHRVESARYMPDADGLSALGVIEHRYWVEASA
ncbi:MAG TPA: hypothetical protein DCP26_03205 [Brevundimonas sp.]|nr:hypothetical protein [Brevundimonas sp.]